MRDWMIVAEIVGTKTLSGRLVVHGAASLPSVLQEGLECVFVPPQFDLPRKGVIESLSPFKEGSLLLQFDSVTDIDTAEGLVGCFCLVRRTNLPESFSSETKFPFQGYLVCDSTLGELGKVVALIEHPLQSRMVVEGSQGEISIPLVDEYLESICEDEGSIMVRLPVGFLEAVGMESRKSKGNGSISSQAAEQ